MKKYILLLLLLASPSWAANYYIAQTAAGSGDGSSCANADALADLTWGPGNMVTAGDTLHLCGTLTSTLTIGSSGAEGSPITITFESGAKFSKAYWGTTTGAAIASASKNYITIDGSTNGIIENTANGTALANQQDSHGVYLNGGTNLEVKNLTIQNLYIRTPDSEDGNGGSTRGIYTDSTSGILIHDNTVNNARYGVIVIAETGAIDAAKIYSNTISACSTALVVAASATGYDLTNIEIYSNTFTGGNEWDSSGDVFHNDGIHTWQYSSGKVFSGKIYANTFDGDWGSHTTSTLYCEGKTSALEIYNNVFNVTGTMPQQGYVSINSTISATARIYNNSFRGLGTDSSGKYGLFIESTNWATLDVRNNIFNNLYAAVVVDSSQALTADYNDYYWNGYVSIRMSGGEQVGTSSSLALWRTYLGGCPGSDNECNSLDSNPAFVSASNLELESGSPARDAGAELTAYFTTDRNGATRTAWDQGAYEYGGSPPSGTYPGVKLGTGAAVRLGTGAGFKIK